MTALDTIVAIIVAAAAVACFSSHVMSSPRQPIWMIFAPAVRVSMLLLGASLLWRAVDLFFVARKPHANGHVDLVGLVSAMMQLIYWVAVAVATFNTRRSGVTPPFTGRIRP